MQKHQVTTQISGLGFPEALRWHDGALWFSDMFRGRIVRWQPGAAPETIIDQSAGGPEMPGGLGWLPDGTLLLVDCLQRRIFSWRSGDGLAEYADLSGMTEHPLNDMFVDADGTAWVGGYGFNPESDQPAASPIYRISTSGKVSPTPSHFVFPNGTERFGDRISVAETFANRVTFANDQGEIVQSFAWPTGSGPDGLSFASDGRLFVASAFSGSLDVLDPNGSISNVVSLAEENRTATQEAGGPRGIFDCAVHPDQALVAYSSAALDEPYAMQHDTGLITLLRLSA